MAASIKVNQLEKTIDYLNDVVNELVQENHELKTQLAESMNYPQDDSDTYQMTGGIGT